VAKLSFNGKPDSTVIGLAFRDLVQDSCDKSITNQTQYISFPVNNVVVIYSVLDPTLTYHKNAPKMWKTNHKLPHEKHIRAASMQGRHWGPATVPSGARGEPYWVQVQVSTLPSNAKPENQDVFHLLAPELEAGGAWTSLLNKFLPLRPHWLGCRGHLRAFYNCLTCKLGGFECRGRERCIGSPF
jgi:hypothetical protein